MFFPRREKKFRIFFSDFFLSFMRIKFSRQKKMFIYNIYHIHAYLSTYIRITRAFFWEKYIKNLFKENGKMRKTMKKNKMLEFQIKTLNFSSELWISWLWDKNGVLDLWSWSTGKLLTWSINGDWILSQNKNEGEFSFFNWWSKVSAPWRKVGIIKKEIWYIFCSKRIRIERSNCSKLHWDVS